MNKNQFYELLENHLDKEDVYKGNEKSLLTEYFNNQSNNYANTKDTNIQGEIEGEVIKIQGAFEEDNTYMDMAIEMFLDETDFDPDNPLFQVAVDIAEDSINRHMNDDGKFIYSYPKIEPYASSMIPKGFDKEFSAEDFLKNVMEIQYNREAQGKLEAFNNNTMGEANNLQPGDNTKYPYKQKFNWFWNNIINVEDEDYFSIANHALVGEKSFKENMAELLTRGSYESLGITRAEANIEDPTPFTPITPEDAKVIAENYIKEGSDSFKKDLAHYYTKYDEQQWNANIPNNIINGPPPDMNEFA
jgi:hypothetical protein